MKCIYIVFMQQLRVMIGILFLGSIGCADIQGTTKLDSAEMESKTKRIAILQQQIIAQSEIADAEFQLFNVNGFSNGRIGVPGVSSANYKFAIKVDTSDIEAWTDGLEKVEEFEPTTDWTKILVKNRKPDWEVKSQPEYYIRKGAEVYLVVYRQEGILFKHLILN